MRIIAIFIGVAVVFFISYYLEHIADVLECFLPRWMIPPITFFVLAGCAVVFLFAIMKGLGV